MLTGNFRLAILAVILAVGGMTSRIAHASPDFDAAIDRAVHWEMQAKAIPSVEIGLVGRNGVVWTRAWGHADAQGLRPADPRTIYRIGSVSKLFTDTAIMRLVEAGRIDLDRPVSTYLPDFHPHNPFGGQITVRELMTHRSGLVREPPRGNYFDEHPLGQSDTVLSLNDTTLVAAPGSLTKYSNAGIAVLGEILSKVDRKSYDQALRELMLDPLDMDGTGLSLSAAEPRLAYAEMTSFDGPRFPAPRFDIGTPAAGNVYTTADDLAHFVQAMLNQGRTASQPLVKPSTLSEMWRIQYPGDKGPRFYGLGYMVGRLDDQPMVGHGGAIYGFGTELRMLPEAGLGVIVFTTVDSNTATIKLARYALSAWLDCARGAAPPPYGVSDPVVGAAARRFVGWYRHGDAGLSAEIFRGRLVIDAPETAGGVRRAPDGRYRLEDALVDDDKLALAADGRWIELDGVRYQRVVQPRPDPPPASMAGLIGEYGWPHNVWPVYERDGRLYVRAEWIDSRPMTPIDHDTWAFPKDRGLYLDEAIRFERGDDGRATAFWLSGYRFPRLDPKEGGAGKAGQGNALTETSLPPAIAEALGRARGRLRTDGLDVEVRAVAPPRAPTTSAKGARTPSEDWGVAVDIAAVDEPAGRSGLAPSPSGDTSNRAYSNFIGGTSLERWRRDRLRAAMEAEGFSVRPEAWWKFDYIGAEGPSGV